MLHEGLSSNFKPEDWSWLLQGIKRGLSPVAGKLTVELLIDIWRVRGMKQRDLTALRKVTDKNPELNTLVANWTSSREPNLEMLRLDEQHRRHVERQEEERRQVKESWALWKQQADLDPVACFRGKRRSDSMWTLINWLNLNRYERSSFHHAQMNWGEIRRVLGNVIGDGFEATVKRYWRQTKPPVWSGRKADEKNTVWYSQTGALTGLSVESKQRDWTKCLSIREARRASEWGLVELNGFPEWMACLANDHPVSMRAALKRELIAELAEANTLAHARTLGGLLEADVELLPLVAPLLKQRLAQWPSAPRNATKEHTYTQNLILVISIVTRAGAADSGFTDICERRFLGSPNRDSAIAWLKGLCAVDLRRGTEAIRKGRSALRPSDRDRRSLAWIGGLFADRNRVGLPISIDSDTDCLLNLTKLAYDCVRRDADVQHEGAFSPGVRDDAEFARSRLLGILVKKSGPDAHRALRELAKESLFAHMPDRLNIMARQRAADDSEALALIPKELREWEKRFEYAPRNRNELFLAMLDRLDDIQHDILHHDFSDRHILANINQESEMQPLLARKLQDAARGHYSVGREEEVADKKKTDIRLSGTASNDRCVIEIKLGDNWSVNELERAITEQLLAQYLRHQSCSAGCLLITYAGRKGFENPDTSKPISFENVIERLASHAATIEMSEKGRIRLAIVGLDLRPQLPLREIT